MDVAVVGGGIAGLVSAYFLSLEGLSVAVVEAGRIIEDVTGYTTGKITSQHGLIYGYLTEKLGIDKARLYGEANQEALEKIAALIERKWIPCDFRRTSAYLFTEKSESLEIVRAETEAAKNAGLPACFVKETPLPFARGAVCFENQARFHPRKLLLALAEEITSGGGYIIENTRALDIGDDRYPELITDRGIIQADSIVVATNVPFFHSEVFTPRLTPTRSHVLGLRLNGPVPDGLHYGIDGNGESIRSQPMRDGSLLMVGSWYKGPDVDDVTRQYERIEQKARTQFDIGSIDYHWWTRDLKTPDRLPFIGRMPGLENVYMVAGFGGWGMTTSFVGAPILVDLIKHRANPYAALFDPARETGSAPNPEENGELAEASKSGETGEIDGSRLSGQAGGLADASKTGEATETGNISQESAAKINGEEEAPGISVGLSGMEELNNGEGRVMDLDGAKVAVYRDDEGNLSGVSAKCTHMGCQVGFNPGKKTWDCPCHGSRFSLEGKVVQGPASDDLERVDLALPH